MRGLQKIGQDELATRYKLVSWHRRYNITVTSNPWILHEWIKNLLAFFPKVLVGFDVCYHPNPRIPGSDVAPIIATIQFCYQSDPDRPTDPREISCMIFQLQHASQFAPVLESFLNNQNVRFTGIDTSKDIERLAEVCGFRVSHIAFLMDLRNWDVVLGLQRTYHPLPEPPKSQVLSELANPELRLKYRKPKWVNESNWTVEDLSEAQVVYAALDCGLMYLLGSRLLFFIYRHF